VTWDEPVILTCELLNNNAIIKNGFDRNMNSLPVFTDDYKLQLTNIKNPLTTEIEYKVTCIIEKDSII